jgi:hypothetical protein
MENLESIADPWGLSDPLADRDGAGAAGSARPARIRGKGDAIPVVSSPKWRGDLHSVLTQLDEVLVNRARLWTHDGLRAESTALQSAHESGGTAPVDAHDGAAPNEIGG